MSDELAARVHALIAHFYKCGDNRVWWWRECRVCHGCVTWNATAWTSGRSTIHVGDCPVSALEAAISPADPRSDDVPSNEADSAQPLATPEVKCDKSVDKYAAVHALIAQWREIAEHERCWANANGHTPEHRSLAEYLMRAAEIRRSDADALEAALAAAQPEQCICGEADGMAVYSAECPNELHAKRARKVAALAAALAPPNDLTVEEVAALQQGLADVQAGRITPLAQIDAEREPVATASSQTTWTVAAADVETTNYKRIDESLKPAAALATNSEKEK